ncbi:MAG: tetratricopeptide repeat protein, partial [Armatimonadota bacterium]
TPRTDFVPGVLYSLAMIHFGVGRLEEALQQAKALADIKYADKAEALCFAATQLVSVISRQIGDLTMAVGKAELAVELASEIDFSFVAKMNLVESLADAGETERALRMAQEALCLIDARSNVPMVTHLQVLGMIGTLAAALGENAILQDAKSKLTACMTTDQESTEMKERYVQRIEANREIRKRIIDISLIDQGPTAINESLTRVSSFPRFLSSSNEEANSKEVRISSLHEANSLTIAPLIKWWEDTADNRTAAALDYDYWGRGCFAQVVQNLRAFPSVPGFAVSSSIPTLRTTKSPGVDVPGAFIRESLCYDNIGGGNVPSAKSDGGFLSSPKESQR